MSILSEKFRITFLFYGGGEFSLIGKRTNIRKCLLKDKFDLENCYVSGISEADFQGTAINCIFKVPFPKSGTFASRPINSPIGFKYFCTDKQTSEGATNGIMIYHKGNNVWVDALGRVIS